MRSLPTPCLAPDGGFGHCPAQPGRCHGIRRDYNPADVARLAGGSRIQHTLADRGARRLWACSERGRMAG